MQLLCKHIPVEKVSFMAIFKWLFSFFFWWPTNFAKLFFQCIVIASTTFQQEENSNRQIYHSYLCIIISNITNINFVTALLKEMTLIEIWIRWTICFSPPHLPWKRKEFGSCRGNSSKTRKQILWLFPWFGWYVACCSFFACPVHNNQAGSVWRYSIAENWSRILLSPKKWHVF